MSYWTRQFFREFFMHRIVWIAAALAATAPANATDVGVSVVAGQPGFYGRLDIAAIGQPPRLVYAQPIVVSPAPATAVAAPIYLRVPPGHAKHWSHHCARYNACAQPVYFVQEGWYNGVYVPYYRQHHGVAALAAPAPVVVPVPAYDYAAPERLYEAPVTSVRAVLGPPEERCWVERQQVVDSGYNVPGAVVGAVVGGVLGHQVGSGRGRDVATAGGAVAGAAMGANVGRGSATYGQDVQRCTTVASGRPAYWDVTYRFRGVAHRVQLVAPPGRVVMVDEAGVPRS